MCPYVPHTYVLICNLTCVLTCVRKPHTGTCILAFTAAAAEETPPMHTAGSSVAHHVLITLISTCVCAFVGVHKYIRLTV